VGVGLAVGAALSYAVTVVLNRSLATDGLDGAVVLSLRFGVASALLLVALAVLRRSVLPVPGERWRVLLLGVVGYGLESMLFFAALERGTTAAVSLLFYTYPAVVTVLELVLGRAEVDRRRLVALGLSVTGTALVIAAGSSVSISRAGVVLALAASVSFACYLLASEALVRRTAALTAGAWIAVGAGVSMVVRAAVTGATEVPSGHWPELVGNGVATSAAFALMFASLRRIGAGRTAVVMTLEAFFSIVLAALFLHESMRPLQGVGGTAILAATVLIARARRTPVEV
jgi:drug/metabolite transporter (DMT)-like permease